jgi:hypothetical protein
VQRVTRLITSAAITHRLYRSASLCERRFERAILMHSPRCPRVVAVIRNTERHRSSIAPRFCLRAQNRGATRTPHPSRSPVATTSTPARAPNRGHPVLCSVSVYIVVAADAPPATIHSHTSARSVTSPPRQRARAAQAFAPRSPAPTEGAYTGDRLVCRDLSDGVHLFSIHPSELGWNLRMQDFVSGQRRQENSQRIVHSPHSSFSRWASSALTRRTRRTGLPGGGDH